MDTENNFAYYFWGKEQNNTRLWNSYLNTQEQGKNLVLPAQSHSHNVYTDSGTVSSVH